MEKKQARVYKSSLISDLLNQIPENEKQIQLEKMRLAAKIDDARIAKGFSKGQLAKEMGVTNAVVTKWLSGTHNLTTENLIKIGCVLDIKLVDTHIEKPQSMLQSIFTFKKRKTYNSRSFAKTTDFLDAAEPMTDVSSLFSIKTVAFSV